MADENNSLSDATLGNPSKGKSGSLVAFPRAHPSKQPSDNLPLELSSFVGREREVADVKGLLTERRLVSLTGPGGCGKTRLALAVAQDLVEEFEDGVWWVELASTSDPSLVPQAVASALGVREVPARSPTEVLVEHQEPRKTLLVLDNCEHLVEGCAVLADALLRACPDLKILVTSREPLRIAGESNWSVPSLSLPDPGRLPPTGELARYEAVRLFLERAKAVDADFAVTERNMPAVARLCHKLDGMPLAIELAAARVRALTAEQISEKLEDPLGLLTTGSRATAERHQTLRATLEWSYELLSEPERTLFGRLSVFAGGWDLEAAEAVGAGGGIKECEVLDLLSSLVGKSLVVADASEDDALRYRMLEPVRQYARERLEETGQVRKRHAQHYLALVEAAAPELLGADQGRWLRWLRTEFGNLREAHSWSMEPGEEAERARLRLRLPAALWRFWGVEGFEDGKRWLQTALERDPGGFPAVRARALDGLGFILIFQQDYGQAIDALEEAISLYKDLGDRAGTAFALANLGYAVLHGDYRERVSAFVAEAEALMMEDLDGHAHAYLRTIAATATLAQGDVDLAVARVEESLALYREVGDLRNTGMSLFILGMTELNRGDLDRGATLLEEGARIALELRDRLGLPYQALGLGKLSALQEQPVRAARLWGAAEALREQMGMSLSRFDLAASGYEQDLAAVRSALSEASFEAAWTEGRTMAPEQAIEYALAEPPQEETPADRILSADASVERPKEDGDRRHDLPVAQSGFVGSEHRHQSEATGTLSVLRIHLLGDFHLARGDEPITTVDTARLQSLLAYLVLHARAPQSRERLAFLFWPDSRESQARTNLRQLLHQLRRTLPDADSFLQADARTIRWLPEAPYELDVAGFEHTVDRAEQAERQGDRTAARAALEEAAKLYRGDLLPGCYEDWIEPERERLRQRYIEGMERLVRLLEEQRDYAGAITYAQHLLRQDPLREDGYLSLMRLQALNGDRTGALRTYHDCATMLQRELGVDPDPATRAMHERLLDAHAAQEEQPAAPELPLVGRQREWASLREAWRDAARGRAHVVLVAGEAGIGKTRLAEELLRWTVHQGMTTARTRCYAAEGGPAYAPVTDWLRADALQEALGVLDGVWLTEVARLLPELLVERPDLHPPEPLTQGWQRQRLFEALSRAVLAAKQPMLLVVDDLQWCDAETLEWLRHLARFDPSAKLLIVGTVRTAEVPENHPLRTLLVELHRTEQVTEISLEPLEATETASLAAHVAGVELAEGRAYRLYRETEGNPLFVVESVRAGLHEEEHAVSDGQEESSAALLASEPTALPLKVHAILAERLAQLSPQARELAGLAATIGRSFTFSVLAEADDCDEDALVLALDELWQRRIVREHGADAYDFSHDKLREVAYAGVSPARRRLLHRRVARALETVYASDPDTVSGRLAAHYRQAGLPEQAIPYYRRAGEWALRLSAYEEAIADLTQGLELLETLPDAPERARQEFGLQIALGVALRATKGWSAPEVGEAYSRAWTLGRQAGETPRLAPVLWGLGTFHTVRAELETARELGEQCLRLNQDDPNLLTAGNLLLGMSLFNLGEPVPAREHLERTLAVYNPLQHRSYASLLVAHPGVFCLSFASHVLWHLGYPQQAVERSHQALSLARELSHPFSLAIALAYGTMLSQFRREARAAAESAEAAVALCTEHGFAYYLAWAKIIRGWTLAEQGEGKGGIAQMRQGLADLRNTGAGLREPYYLALLAHAHARSGEREEGLLVLDEAMALMEKTEERSWEAELYRLKGELLPDSSEAEACFRQALDVSRNQDAKSLELRVAMGLCRLWRRRGEKSEAHRALREVFDRFTEGFDTPDLKEAASLLQELA